MNTKHLIRLRDLTRARAMRLIISVASLWLAASSGANAAGARNPIVWADVPDPAVIREGDVYYMSSTTMHLCPGVPVMKSKDLVNWEMVGYACQKLEDNDETTLQNGKNMYGRGSWASSLRHHTGCSMRPCLR